jgi:hypothetical protein
VGHQRRRIGLPAARHARSADGQVHAPRAEAKGDIEEFSIADDGSFIAYAVNETGISKLRLLDRRPARSAMSPRCRPA